MDPRYIDQLARLLGQRPSRRAAFAVLAGALGRLLAPAAASDAQQLGCRPLGGRCLPARDLDCCAGTTCRDGRCVCPRGKRRCGERCIPANRCCNTKCSGGADCRNDRCVCAAGMKRCRGRCIPRGACCAHKECGACARCRGGRCRPVTCPAGQACQDGRCTCTGAACPGCCDGTTCRAGTTPTHCKGPGPACQSCGDDEGCEGAACGGCMPDSASCLASGPLCDGPGQPPCGDCCSSGIFFCNPGQRCCGPSHPGDICGPGVPCVSQGDTIDCVCNRCCVRSGEFAFTFGECATCCSGECDQNNPVLCA